MANILWLQSLVKIVYITSVKNNSSRFAAHGSSFVWVGRQKTNIKQGKSFFVTTYWDDCTMHIESQLHGTELTVCCTSSGNLSTKSENQPKLEWFNPASDNALVASTCPLIHQLVTSNRLWHCRIRAKVRVAKF